MTIVKFNPERGALRADTFSSLLDRFFDETVNATKLAGFTPRVDVWETEAAYSLEVALPGMNENDIQIDFQEGRLTISGERKFEKEEKEQKFHLLETHYGSFSRTFNLPDKINAEAIEARFENGLLQINVPKDVKKVQKHQIKINSGNARPSSSANGKAKSNGRKEETVAV